MKILLDTNIILDIWLSRAPHDKPAAELLTLAEKGQVAALVCANTLTTLHYFARKHSGEASARQALRLLLQICNVAAVNRGVIEKALQDPMADFEDAVLYESAKQAEADILVTRNIRDFKNAAIPIMSSPEVLARLQQE